MYSSRQIRIGYSISRRSHFSNVHFILGKGNTWEEEEAKKSQKGLQQACNMLATCFQPACNYGAAPALVWT
jgi:hypothetical protein